MFELNKPFVSTLKSNTGEYLDVKVYLCREGVYSIVDDSGEEVMEIDLEPEFFIFDIENLSFVDSQNLRLNLIEQYWDFVEDLLDE